MKKGVFLFGWMILGFVGCVSVKIPVEVLRPAPATLPRMVKRVGVCDRSFLSRANTAVIFENGEPSSRFAALARLAPNSGAQAVEVELSAFRRFDVSVFESSEQPGSGSAFSVPDAATLTVWNKDSLFDAVVSLESFQVNISSSGGVFPTVVYDRFGNAFTVPRFQDYRNVSIRILWKIYRTSDGDVLYTKEDEHTLYFAANGYSSDAIYRSLPSRLGSVENAAQVMGIRFAQNFIPFWQSGTRRIYPGQSDAWLEALDSARVGNWDSAADQWEKLARKASIGPLHRQAVYNLTVANEVLGRFEEAEKWANLGRRKFKGREFDGALLYIDRRRVESRELDEQLP
jgi:hypothetical protein